MKELHALVNTRMFLSDICKIHSLQGFYFREGVIENWLRQEVKEMDRVLAQTAKESFIFLEPSSSLCVFYDLQFGSVCKLSVTPLSLVHKKNYGWKYIFFPVELFTSVDCLWYIRNNRRSSLIFQINNSVKWNIVAFNQQHVNTQELY